MTVTKKKEESFSLVPGSLYKIKSAESRDKVLETHGKFRGFASIGQETALAIELEEPAESKGKLRFIPLQVILSVDVLKVAETPEEPKDQSDGVYFG